jgi:hypothetical protein
LVIFGNGQVAEVFHYYLTHEASREVAAFTVDGAYLKEGSHLGLPVVDFESVERRFPPRDSSRSTRRGRERPTRPPPRDMSLRIT